MSYHLIWPEAFVTTCSLLYEFKSAQRQEEGYRSLACARPPAMKDLGWDTVRAELT